MAGDLFEIRIFTNRIIVRNSRTGQSIARVATRPFSSARLLVADLDAATELLTAIFKEMEGWTRFFRLSPKATIQAMEQCEGGLSPVETQILCDLAVRLGFSSVDIL